MKYLCTLTILLIAYVPVAAQSYNSTVLPICTAPEAEERAFIEKMMTHSDWADVRAGFNLGNVSIPEIRVLTEPNDNATCTSLNNKSSIAYNKKNQHNIRVHNVIHFRVRDKYLTYIGYNMSSCFEDLEAPCDDKRSFTAGGLSSLVIYDLSFNELDAVAF